MKTIEWTLKIDGEEIHPSYPTGFVGAQIVRVSEPENGVDGDHPLFLKAVQIILYAMAEALDHHCFGEHPDVAVPRFRLHADMWSVEDYAKLTAAVADAKKAA